jgi:hypothetical protein
MENTIVKPAVLLYVDQIVRVDAKKYDYDKSNDCCNACASVAEEATGEHNLFFDPIFFINMFFTL